MPRGKPFKEGNSGRPKGAENKLTRTVKETVLNAFLIMQQDKKHNLIEFAKKYPRDFYAIAAKLIPTEIKGAFNGKTTLEIVRRSSNTANPE